MLQCRSFVHVTAAIVLGMGCCAGVQTSALGQAKCTTTFDCAQQSVEAAARALTAVQALEQRIAKLEAFHESVGNGRVLAMIEVKKSKLTSATPGVAFDPGTGLVSFPNPKSLQFLPVVSDANEDPYITQTHWIRQILGPDKFIVRAKAMDTGDRTWPPHDFVAVVIGFEPPPKKN